MKQLSDWVGKYVIVRSRNEGVNFGLLCSADTRACVIAHAQRLYHHKPEDKTQAWYEGVANTGLSADSELSSAVDFKCIVEDYSLTLCTSTAVDSIQAAPTKQQS